MTAHGIDITLHFFSLAMVLGITGIGLAALPWSQRQTREVEEAFVFLARLGRGWFASRLRPFQATRTNPNWHARQGVCIS